MHTRVEIRRRRRFVHVWMWLTLMFAASSCAFAQDTSCPVAKISIDKFHVYDEDIVTHVIGRINNHCDTATGVQIKVTFYDAAGNIARVEDPWPASTNNIPPHSDFPFEFVIERVKSYAKVGVRVIATNHW